MKILITISKHNEEIKGLQITQKYVKEKLICEEKEKHLYKRVLSCFNMEINMIFSKKKSNLI